MPLHIINTELWFPPVEDADKNGLLAIGGDLSTERLLLAYSRGIFPWYEDNIPLWWYPNPRFILFPENLVISRSMNKLLKKNAFKFTINEAFSEVIHNCKNAKRKEQTGTWITDDVKKAFINLHYSGYAHSAETWLNNKLVGGLYGVRLGNVFFGESMFSFINNASKYAFIKYIHQLMNESVKLIDCQVYTNHLASLGAAMISKQKFKELLKENIAGITQLKD